MRQGNTGRERVAGGKWTKVGGKVYRHVSGAEIRFDNTRWAWEVKGTLYSTLWAAKAAFDSRGSES